MHAVKESGRPDNGASVPPVHRQFSRRGRLKTPHVAPRRAGAPCLRPRHPDSCGKLARPRVINAFTIFRGDYPYDCRLSSDCHGENVRQTNDMNLYKLKSFHESALDQWNSIAIVLAEASNTVEADKRQTAFIQAVMELTNIAGTDQSRRQNILKGANVFHLAGNPTTSKGTQQTSNQGLSNTKRLSKERPSVVKRMANILLKAIIVMILLALLAGSFALGRFSRYPRFHAFIPPTLASLSDNATPAQVVKQYFDASQQGDMTKLMELFHIDKLRDDGDYIISESKELAHYLTKVKDINILQDYMEAHLIIQLTTYTDEAETGEFSLLKNNGRWLIEKVDF